MLNLQLNCKLLGVNNLHFRVKGEYVKMSIDHLAANDQEMANNCGQGDVEGCAQSPKSVLERNVQTGRSVSRKQVEELAFTNLTKTSVILTWKVDPCANAYNVYKSYDNSERLLEYLIKREG